MTDLRKAAEMALEALDSYPLPFQVPAREALRQALAQSEQEREWVGLTDDEIENYFLENVNTGCLLSFGAGAAYAEAKLKEKNT